jgi:hypothetical protein
MGDQYPRMIEKCIETQAVYHIITWMGKQERKNHLCLYAPLLFRKTYKSRTNLLPSYGVQLHNGQHQQSLCNISFMHMQLYALQLQRYYAKFMTNIETHSTTGKEKLRMILSDRTEETREKQFQIEEV